MAWIITNIIKKERTGERKKVRKNEKKKEIESKERHVKRVGIKKKVL